MAKQLVQEWGAVYGERLRVMRVEHSMTAMREALTRTIVPPGSMRGSDFIKATPAAGPAPGGKSGSTTGAAAVVSKCADCGGSLSDGKWCANSGKKHTMPEAKSTTDAAAVVSKCADCGGSLSDGKWCKSTGMKHTTPAPKCADCGGSLADNRFCAETGTLHMVKDVGSKGGASVISQKCPNCGGSMADGQYCPETGQRHTMKRKRTEELSESD